MDVLEKDIYCKMYGYSSVEEMHEDVTLDQAIHNISVPTFCFGAVDDMMFGNQFIPFKDFK